MLNKRIQILFDEQLANKIVERAKQDNLSMGEFIRSAVTDKLEQEELSKKRQNAYDQIQTLREKYGKKYAKGKDSVAIIREMREERTKHLLHILHDK
ncbi:MAG TPA: hypothetical protein VMR41_02535 [Patescibacteria group bacterium]|nr:hypothetical protein [Patescibacteria group bacterium]